MREIDCAVARDLIPLAAEDMVEPETKETLMAHVATCEACRAALEAAEGDREICREANLAEAEPIRRLRFRAVVSILGLPLWLPLLIAALAVAAGLLLSGWAVVISLCAIPVSLGAGTAAGAASGAAMLLSGDIRGLAAIAGSLLLAAGGCALAWFLIRLVRMCWRGTAALGRYTAGWVTGGKYGRAAK